jgi:hypothetical protein
MVTSPRRSSEVSVAAGSAGPPAWMKNRPPETTSAPAMAATSLRVMAILASPSETRPFTV